jgi:tight adherence protein C
MSEFLPSFDAILLLSVFSSLVLFGLMFYFWQSKQEAQARTEVRNRLEIKTPGSRLALDGKPLTGAAASKVAGKLASKTDKYYSANDPAEKRKIQLKLIQAGYSHPSALGYFLAARFACGIGLFILAGLYSIFITPDKVLTSKILLMLLVGSGGYFLPNFNLNGKIKKRQLENRSGFPDVMDLMVVSAEAGLTTEASIERIAHEIARTHPVLSEQLSLAAIEIRAGKPLDESLRAFGDRVGLDEVQGFATMIQQSKELGTSVSDALRVYSDEMRHKRMMAAEEKAYALPAKLSIPVTGFILPIVIGVAVIPTAVRMMTQ